ncbi:MAG: alpha-amylase family glycosyl hydrolase, partial [Ketobacteraceae bacterium]|nr:alpha-amylase family glycosyl hydrolase [Ketobacteraceae bacterium]
VPEAHRGKYLGVCEPAVIEHLRSLGITTLELMPCQAMMDEVWLAGKGLTNYWGYNPVALMAPSMRYAVRDPVTEFRTMVNRLHEAGIEVIVDLVFNHTAEGDSTGPVLSFKGIDVAAYYLTDDRHAEPFVNYTGCGNTMNAMHPRVIQLFMDSLRVWYSELGVDGFRFDLGVTLGRHRDHFLTDHPFFIAIQQDPLLRHAKVIMEPWDLGPHGYQVGKFPGSFAEWNGSFRDCVRTYIRGDRNTLQEFATQFVAPFDKHFQEKDRTETSVNFVTAHDGFTLQDLVSYEHKHNQANGELNRDGCHENHSRNYGTEGTTDNPDILRTRLIQKRNFLTVLALAKGIPMLLMGDEMGRSQQGNNNAYCQDNETSWFDWTSDQHRDLRGFWQKLLQIRRKYCWLYQGTTRIHWHRPDGAAMGVHDWEKPYARSVGCHFQNTSGDQFFMIFNMHDGEIDYQLPHTGNGEEKEQAYRLLMDTTRLDDTADCGRVVSAYVSAPHSISLFLREADTETQQAI